MQKVQGLLYALNYKYLKILLKIFILLIPIFGADFVPKNETMRFSCISGKHKGLSSIFLDHQSVSMEDFEYSNLNSNLFKNRASFSHSPTSVAILKSILKMETNSDLSSVSAKKPKKNVFLKDCGCQYDWMSAFCLRLADYRKLSDGDAPNVCICRCSCCLNQPDSFCDQLNCDEMKPDFGTNSTSCLCFNKSNYPEHICSSTSNANIGSQNYMRMSEGNWQRHITPIEHVMAATPRMPQNSTENLTVKTKRWQKWLDFLSDSKNEAWTFVAILVLGLTTGLCISFICLARSKKERQKVVGNGRLDEERCNRINMNELEPLDGHVVTTTIVEETNNTLNV